MRRACPGLLVVLALALAGCGGSGKRAPDPGPGPPPERPAVVDLRSADARSPLVAAGDGAWRCPTEGRLALAVSEEGEASLTIDGRVLASVAPTRSVVNRICAAVGSGAAAAARLGPGPPRGRLGAATVHCGAPAMVLVALRDGDITVRTPGGRFVAGAAVRADRIGVAAYWGARCTTL